MALLDTCTDLNNCAVAWAASCTSSPNANLNGVGMTVGDYLCACQEERPLWSHESKTERLTQAWLRRMFFGTKRLDEDVLGTPGKTFFTLKDVGGMPSKSVRSVDGKGVEFLTYEGNDHFTNVTVASTGATITVANTGSFAANMSIEIVTQNPTDPCCYDKVIRKVLSVDSATQLTLDSAVTVVVDARVIVRFSEITRCNYFDPFDYQRDAKRFKSFFQTLGHDLCFDVDDLNACHFTDFNQTITDALYGQMLSNKYKMKVADLGNLIMHEMLMAVNTGINREMTTTQSGETLGIETAMAYARNVLNIENEFKIQAMSPRAIFQALLDIVIDHQQDMSGKGDYVVGCTRKLYSWIKNNQEYLRASGEVSCCNSDSVYKIGNVMIDTGYGKIEFIVDPYIDLVYKEKMLARFMPDETTKLYTPMYHNISSNGELVSIAGGMKVEDKSFLNVGKAKCDICHAYSYEFAFVPGWALVWDIFKVEIVQS